MRVLCENGGGVPIAVENTLGPLQPTPPLKQIARNRSLSMVSHFREPPHTPHWLPPKIGFSVWSSNFVSFF